jgi:hypothetical protein
MNPNDPMKYLAKILHEHDVHYGRSSSASAYTDINREIMKPFEPQGSLIQSILDQERRTAAIYQNLNSVSDEIRKHFSGTASYTDINRGVLSFVAEHQSVFQKAIDAATRSAIIPQNLNAQMAQAADAEKLARLYASSPFDQLKKSIESSSAHLRIWQSTQIAALASRVVHDADFRGAFIGRLEAEMPIVTGQIESPESNEQLLDLIEREITESGVAQASSDATTSLNQLFSLWSGLPQDLRTIVMMLIVMLLQVALQYSSPAKQQPTTQVVVKQHVKIIQNISNNYFTSSSLQKHEHSYFGVVAKEQLPVFGSNRKDSVRLAILSATQLVIIKNQKRNWILIEWRDAETNEMRSGWTFTRYVKKI